MGTKREEFADLVQGSMTVEQYAAKFIELSRFGPHLILIEMKKASRFQKGLNERLRHHLIASGVDNEVEVTQNVRGNERPRVARIDPWDEAAA